MARSVSRSNPEGMPRNTLSVLDLLQRFARSTHSRLVVCHRCGSDFVNPVAWHEDSQTHWWIRLRCGECGLVREVEVTDEAAQRFELELDRGVRKIAASLARVDRERMIADADTLTAALELDLIGPNDFQPLTRP
jgi:ribosomal protein S27AE